MVLVENAVSGNYTVRAKGTAQGRYTILVGSLGMQGDTWKKIEGEITNINPSQEVDEYTVSFSSTSPDKHPVDAQNLSSLITNVITVITDINGILNNSFLTKAKTNLELASTYLQQGKKGFAKGALENAQTQLLTALFVMPDTYREQVVTMLSNVENIYDRAGFGNSGYSKSTLQKDLATLQKAIEPAQTFLLSKKTAGKDVHIQVRYIQLIREKIEDAASALSANNLPKVFILIRSSKVILTKSRQ